MENKINYLIPEEVVTLATAKLGEVAEILKPYLITLTAAQRMELPKMNDDTLPFVLQCLEYCQSNPEFAPIYIDFNRQHEDIKTFEQLLPLYHIAQQLGSNLNDTITQAGSESFTSSLSYFNSVKYATKMGAPGAKAIAEDLSRLLVRQNKSVPIPGNN